MRVAATLDAGVEALMREVGRAIVMPRFRTLDAADIEEKTPGELVTVADREAERALAAGLTALFADARVVGEEACAADPSLLDGLDRGAVWIVDPIDGTANFAAGRPPFGIIVALAVDGVTHGAWILDPLTGRFCRATLGGGAWVDGQRITTVPIAARRPVIALATQFMAAEAKATLVDRAGLAFDVVPIPRCAAEHYPRLARGDNDVAVFQRTLPWDHAGGALFLTEAGGRVTRWNGDPYVFHDNALGILAAASPNVWNHAAATLGLNGLAGTRDVLPQALDPTR